MNTIFSRFVTRGGVTVNRSSSDCDADQALLQIARALDSQAGMYVRCGVDYPGRYRRHDIAFVNPPVKISARQNQLEIEALNTRGQILLPECQRALATLPASVVELVDGAEQRLLYRLKNQPEDVHLSEEQRSRRPGVMTLIRSLLSHFNVDTDALLGLYGAFAYDLAFQFEPVKQRLPRSGQQDMVLYLPDEILLREQDSAVAQRLRYDFFCRDNAGHLQTTGGLKRESSPSVIIRSQPPSQPDVCSDHASGEFAAVVEKARSHFLSGHLFEVVPSQTLSCPLVDAPSVVFERLCRDNPAPYGALINLGSSECLISASPEMFVRVKDGRVETCPISGTIKRGGNAMEDADRIRELLNSEKDQAELTMCTDVDRNDKSRICVPGTVQILGRRQIELYSRLIHTVDHVAGQLLPEFDALDAFLSHAWAVTVTGAPKKAAMQFIEDHEKTPRQWYGGAFGRLGFDGNMDTGLTLRTIHVAEGMARVRAGATLLLDSDPSAEEAETRLKAEALLAALQPPEVMSVPHSLNRPARSPDKNSATPVLRALMVDHQDSFVHTLAAAFRLQGVELETLRPERARAALQRSAYDLVILSPGPGTPADFECNETLSLCESQGLPVFGVCLGLQAMVAYCGGSLRRLSRPVHGRAGRVAHTEDALFAGLPSPFPAGRYHSLVADTVPECLRVTARSEEDDCVMAVRHRELPWTAVQFHPESLLTQQRANMPPGTEAATHGDRLIANVVSEVQAWYAGLSAVRPAQRLNA